MKTFEPGLNFYKELLNLIAVSTELQMELLTMLKKAIEEPRSFYDESGNYILSERGLTYSIDSRLTSKFVLVDKLIGANQMVEVDWKEAETEIRIWINEIAKTKGYDFQLSTDKKYRTDTFETILSINDTELETMGYCLEMIDINSDSYVFTIVPLVDKQLVHGMFDKLK